MNRIILIRHGETDWNREGRSQGWADNELSELGLRQAELLGDYVRERYDVSKVISSDLKRCTQTADALGKRYRTDPLLREIDTGKFSGLLWEDIQSRYPEESLALSESIYVSPPEGESWLQVMARAGKFIDEWQILSSDGDVVLVTHGGTIKCFIVALLGLPLDSVHKFNMGNTGITVIGHGRFNGTLSVWLDFHNSTVHLEPIL